MFVFTRRARLHHPLGWLQVQTGMWLHATPMQYAASATDASHWLAQLPREEGLRHVWRQVQALTGLRQGLQRVALTLLAGKVTETS